MAWHRWTPSAALAPYVQHFWSFDGDAPAHARERRLPDPDVQLVFNLRDDRFDVDDGRPLRLTGGVVCGPRATPFEFGTAQQRACAGLVLTAAGAWSLFGSALGAMADAHVDLDALWGAGGAELRERVACAKGAEARHVAMASAVSRVLARATSAGHPAVAFALGALTRDPSGTTVARVAERAGLSARRLSELFHREVGIAPKRYARVRRFQRALARLRAPDATCAAEIALACGYFDQAHLIREFRDLCGTTPRQYLAMKPQHANHLPLG